MNTEKLNISEFLLQLSDLHPLETETISSIVSEIDVILRYDPEVYYKGQAYYDAWDDAWDAMHLFGPHSNALPYLMKMALNKGESSSDDEYARKWAVRAISKIDGDISEVLPFLQQLQQGDNRSLRQEAKKCLRKHHYHHLVKRRWYDWF